MPSPNKTGGPVVKSGPTAGKNRSRNKDGTWRKKRSDSGQKRSQMAMGRSILPIPITTQNKKERCNNAK